MTGTTKHYGLVKPTVGGSENEWGGNLNDDLDDIDGLLGGDQPIYGINIQPNPNIGDDDNETSVDGSVITGEIGREPGEGEDPTSIHPSTEISGKVKRLEGMDDPDGVITNCDVTTRELTVTESITEQVKLHSPTDDITFKAQDGTMHYLSALNDQQEITLIIASGQAMTLMMEWNNPVDGTAPTSVVWNNPIKWVGGGAPDIVDGVNVIQIWAVGTAMGLQIFGAGAGAAS